MSRMSLGASLMLGASFVVLAAGSAFAGELKADGNISSVVVFPTGATVTRTIPVTLPAGATTVVVGDLPAGVETDSIKVEGTADRSFAIASVDTRLVAGTEGADPQRVDLNTQIEVIDDKLAAIADRLDALEGRKRFLTQLIEAAPNGFGKALAEGGADITQWNAAAATIGDGLATVAEAERAAHIEERGLDRQRDQLEQALAALPQPHDHTSISVAVSAEQGATATLLVSYHIASARWAPAYDAQLSTGEGTAAPSLSLVRRAEVTQATGEDWNGVKLTLSTAQALGGTAVPELQPYLVSLYDPKDYDSSSNLAAPAPTAPMMREMAGQSAADAAPEEKAKVIEAAADFGDFRAEYRAPGLVSVATDVGARSLQVATEKLTPDLSVHSAPALSTTAFLQASFDAPAGAPLLAGKVALFRDGTFVGNGALPFVNAGETVDLGFGVDDRVHVERVTLDRKTGEHGILSTVKTDTHRYKITVHNLHTRPIEITVLDRLPFAENDDISIKRLDVSTEPTEANVDDRRGIMAWTYTYAPGESRDIVNAWEVSWPAGQSLVSLD